MKIIDDLLETYLIQTDGLDPLKLEDARRRRDILRTLMREHPEHADALAEFAATESIIENSPDTDMQTESGRLTEEAFVRRGMETARRLLKQLAQRKNSSEK